MALNLDLSNIQERGTVVPDGSYNVIIDRAEVTATKSGGEMIKVQLRIIDGEHAGRVIFDSWNIKNANPQATQIGLGQLRGMMRSFGHPNPDMLQSTAELVGLKGNVATKVEESKDYPPQARVKAYKPIAGAAPAADGAAAAAPVKDPFA